MHARFCSPVQGRLLSTDKSTEFLPRLPQSWNRYAYGRGNPIRLVDPDGADTRDKIEGSINAFVSNLLLGAGRQEPRNDDYQKGQVAGDLAASLAGAAEADQGAGGVVLSAVCALLSIGTCAPIAVESGAASAGLLVHGAMVTAVAGRNLADGVSQMQGRSNGVEFDTTGLERQLAEHEKKLADYKANPDAHDNQGHLAQAGGDEQRRQKIIDGRIRSLERQIQNFKKLISDLKARQQQ